MLKKILKTVVLLIVILVVLAFGYLYQKQEELIFHPTKLEQSHRFDFDIPFEERSFTTNDGVALNGVHFKVSEPKGLVFYLHGNSGSIQNYLGSAYVFTKEGYDVFIYDYRGFGKSEGEINGEKLLFKDNQFVYDALKKEYAEKDIIMVGYSIGSGMAAKLASTNDPNQLILLAPYHNFKKLVGMWNKFTPTFLLKYSFETDLYLKDFKKPITIFHGEDDAVIPHSLSLKLKEIYPDKIKMISLSGQGHNGIEGNGIFQAKIKELLK